MTTVGKAGAMAHMLAGIRQDAVEQARSGHTTEQLAEVLGEADACQVYQAGGRWVADRHWWSGIAVTAGLADEVTELDGRLVLRLNAAGRSRLREWRAGQCLARMATVARYRREGWVAAEALLDRQPAPQPAVHRPPRRRFLRIAGEVAWAAGWGLAGAFVLYLVTH